MKASLFTSPIDDPYIAPASPAMPPESTNARSLYRVTSMPNDAAASSSSRSAWKARPTFVRDHVAVEQPDGEEEQERDRQVGRGVGQQPVAPQPAREGGARRTAGEELPPQQRRLEGETEGEGDEREVQAAQAEGGQADDERDRRAARGAEEPAGRHRQLPAGHRHAGRERADAEEGGVPEGQLAGVAEQQVERQRGDGQGRRRCRA